jgi:23S rRNA pseudouridine1911/1915/1917 synthase
LMTGRTHQIRVHLAARGWPVVGDPVYAKSGWSRIADPQLAETLRAFPRQALHAWRLSFVHPITAQPTIVEAPLPEDMRTLIRALDLTAALEADGEKAGV